MRGILLEKETIILNIVLYQLRGARIPYIVFIYLNARDSLYLLFYIGVGTMRGLGN